MSQSFESYADLGAHLRECRESLHFSHERVARALNIRVKYLRAIEDGDLKELPGIAYARGYVKHVAEYLGIDPRPLLAEFDHLSGRTKRDRFFVPETSRKYHTPSARMVIVSLGLIALIYGCWYLADPSGREETIAVRDIPEKYRALVGETEATSLMDKPPFSCLIPIRMDTPPLCFRKEPVSLPETWLQPDAQFSSQLIFVYDEPPN